jgi:menaquinol-cytochrome c reductase iron-sulfur subunit
MTGTQSNHQDRRGFFARVTQALGAILAGGLGVPAIAYLFTPPKTRASGAWVDAADLTLLKLRAPEEVTFHRVRMDGWKIITEKATAWVVKLNENEVVAYTPQCTHLGCAYRWEEGKGEFLCPCHTSNFSLDGRVLNGPAPRPLDRYQVKLQGTRVMIGPQQPPRKEA